MEFDFTDVMNIKAISIRRTKLTSVLGYWDAVNRSYPTYLEFKNSINKLLSYNLLKIHVDGRFMILSNSLCRKLNIIEQINYFFTKSERLITKILNNLNMTEENIEIELSEEDYNLAMKDYYFKPIS